MKQLKLDILAIGVHPDDVELGCGGTLIKEVQSGRKVGIVDLTAGELGSNGSPELRLKEAEAAAAIMGIHARANLHMPDGFFEINKENTIKVIEQIRRFQPKILIINAISDRHPDHGRASKLCSEASFLAGLARIETSFDGTVQEKWRPEVVYHYIQAYNHEPDVVVDVSEHWEQKMKAVMAYGSQFYTGEEKADTFIASPEFLEIINGRASHYGGHIGARYGEGFTAERYIGVDSLLNLK